MQRKRWIAFGASLSVRRAPLNPGSGGFVVQLMQLAD